MQNQPHIPVLLDEVVHYMAPKDGEVYVDGTFGAGGYSRALLEAANCKVYAIDRDPSVQVFADALKEEFPERIELILGNFGEMRALLKQRNIEHVHGIMLDVGVSSMQLDQAERGFSFQQDGPLDMRMGPDAGDAVWMVNHMDEQALADIIYQYGGERKSRKVAKAIVAARAEEEIITTKQLADIVRKVVKGAKDKIDPATRTFQAIRIWVNDELGELSRALESSEEMLMPQGRLVVVSFHSLEDAMVKRFMREKSGRTQGVSRHTPMAQSTDIPSVFSSITNKAIKPSDEEVQRNVRARSARLRAVMKLNNQEAA